MDIYIPFYLPKAIIVFWDWLFTTFGQDGVVQLLSSIFVLTGAYLAFVSTKRKTAIDIITKNRIDWTNTVRNKASRITFLSHKIANMCNMAAKTEKMTGEKFFNKDKMEPHYDEVHELNGLMTEFRLYFNPYDESEDLLFSILNEIDKELDMHYALIDFSKVNILINRFTEELSKILKHEWERIKKEAGIKSN